MKTIIKVPEEKLTESVSKQPCQEDVPPKQSHQRDAPRNRAQAKSQWCDLHKTKPHGNSECRAQMSNRVEKSGDNKQKNVPYSLRRTFILQEPRGLIGPSEIVII